MAKDYYAILGVPKTASPDEIKKAFRRLAHEHHPDKGGDDKKFKDVNEAYQVLGDPKKRATYDQFGSAAFEQGGGAQGPGGFGFDFSGFGGQGFGGFDPADLGDLGDVLGEMFGFGRAGGRARAPRGQDIQVEVNLGFQEMVFGVSKTISLYKYESCSACQGTGAKEGKRSSCKTCQGAGQVRQAQRTMFGIIQTMATCSDCRGTGTVPETPCSVCKGTGVERKETSLTVELPPGLQTGDALKVERQGDRPATGGDPGDLYVRVRVAEDARFERDDHDLLAEEEVAYSTFVLGGTVSVQGVEGALEARIDPGTPVGTVLTFNNEGIRYGRGAKSRGDLRVRLSAAVPKKPSKEQKEAAESLKRLGL